MVHHDGRPCTLHVVTNLRVDIDDEAGAVRSRSYVTVLQALPELPLQAILTGRYHDDFALGPDPGAWRWAACRMQIDHLGDTTHHTRTEPHRPRQRAKLASPVPNGVSSDPEFGRFQHAVRVGDRRLTLMERR